MGREAAWAPLPRPSPPEWTHWHCGPQWSEPKPNTSHLSRNFSPSDLIVHTFSNLIKFQFWQLEKKGKNNVGIQSLNNSSFHFQSITASLLPTPKNTCLVSVWGCSLFSPKSPLYPDTLIAGQGWCSPLGGTDPRTICLPSHFIRKPALNEGKRFQRWKSSTWWQIDGTGI